MKQTLLTQTSETSSKKNEFSADLCHAIIAANIPFKTLENTHFRNFLEKYCHQKIPSESTLRKYYVQPAYEDIISRIRDNLKDSYLWFSVDETTDSLGRYVANLIVGKLDADGPSRAYLIYTKQLTKTNHETVAHFVNNGLKIINPDEDKVLVAVTDAASYMVPAMKTLKIFFPALVHVTCLAHGLNRVAEQIRVEYEKVNKLISSVKKVFIKAPSRVQAFRQMLPDVALPPEPVLTRWGTWLKAVNYYSEHFSDIKKLLDTLADDAVCVTKAKEILNDIYVQNDLVYIKSHFTFIADTITALESSGKPIYEQIDLLNRAKQKLCDAPGTAAEKVRKKLDAVLQKNTGLKSLFVVADILAGKKSKTESEFPVHLLPRLKYCPLSSVDVERSFSAYKLILSDKRCNFSIENLEKVLIIYCEANYGKQSE
ncbi:uncharacterized protein LOC111617975 [Centruroides sculpturatus]|nr:uncharacterized protein LOC111617975 [Centruroides sculpturatus]